MNNKVVSLEGTIDKESNQLQEPLLYFFEKTSHDEAIERVADSLENETYSEEEEQFLTLILLMGVIFREPLLHYQTAHWRGRTLLMVSSLFHCSAKMKIGHLGPEARAIQFCEFE